MHVVSPCLLDILLLLLLTRQDSRVTSRICDITKLQDVTQHVQGATVIFHCAALVDVEATLEQARRVNLTGTEHVVTACKQLGITRLVYTSTYDVIFAGKDALNHDETAPYPEKCVWGCISLLALPAQS